PPYGSIADGWLCVSTLMHTACFSSNAMTPELSLNTLSVQSTPSAINSNVAAATVRFSKLSITTDPSASTVCPGRPRHSIGSKCDGSAECLTPSAECLYTILLLSVLCTQCSLQVCAKVSSSISRGSRPSPA